MRFSLHELSLQPAPIAVETADFCHGTLPIAQTFPSTVSEHCPGKCRTGPFGVGSRTTAMADHISAGQVEAWLDDRVVRDVERTAEEAAEFSIQLRLSHIPLNVIKEDAWGPLRIVGRAAFDTERTAAVVENPEQRQELLSRIGPVFVATPGFYTFLDEEETSTEFPNVDSIQFEHRLYPDDASQQELMSGLMAIATAIKYVQNTVAAIYRCEE